MKDDLPALFQTANQVLDACGLECPLPVLKCRKRLRQMSTGEVLQITADDPNTSLDFEVYCMRSGNKLVATHAGADGCFHFLISKQSR